MVDKEYVAASKEALTVVDPGASNPKGTVRALLRAVDCGNKNACYLIISQLQHLLFKTDTSDTFEWSTAYGECLKDCGYDPNGGSWYDQDKERLMKEVK